jgi:hypothetical protein
MRIAVIGAGNVGGTLGRGWSEAGHEVVYGVRDPERTGGEPDAPAPLRTPAAAAAIAEVVVLCTPWQGLEDIVAGLGDLTGKVVVDCTNPLLPRLAGLDHPGGRSGAEQVAAWAPGARVVKAFNTTGFNIMAAPGFAEGAASMLVAGDDPAARAAVRGLAADLGFDAVEAGPLSLAGPLEALALLWIRMAMVHGHGRDIAFRLMRR